MTLPRSTRWWPDDALEELERRGGDAQAEEDVRVLWRLHGGPPETA